VLTAYRLAPDWGRAPLLVGEVQVRVSGLDWNIGGRPTWGVTLRICNHARMCLI